MCIWRDVEVWGVHMEGRRGMRCGGINGYKYGMWPCSACGMRYEMGGWAYMCVCGWEQVYRSESTHKSQ